LKTGTRELYRCPFLMYDTLINELGALVTALRTVPDTMNGYPGILYKYADELEVLK
jgi:hypothetical protein